MKPSYTLLVMVFILGAAAQAQVAPATTGPAGFPVSGTLRYDLRYTQTAQFYGGPQGDSQSSIVSGDLAYANSSHKRPFALMYSGGDMWNITGGSGETGVFQHLSASQGIVGRKWTLNFSDNVGYMPQAPTTGFSGIPGVGDLPSQPQRRRQLRNSSLPGRQWPGGQSVAGERADQPAVERAQFDFCAIRLFPFHLP